MDKGNQTRLTEFILLGLSESPQYEPLLFTLFLGSYVITVIANTCLILLYNKNPHLHIPMYFNLANFSFLEICYVSAIVPKMLANFLTECKAISFYGCSLQMYFVFLFGGVECYVLATMAYDRYNAICCPLLYSALMAKTRCIQLIGVSWFIGAVNALIHNILTFTLPFCGRNRIEHFFCDVPAILELACTDTRVNEIVLFLVAGYVIIGSLLLILLSYIKIISAILNIHSSSGRQKAFSTCASHFVVVAIFYVSGIFMYFRPKSSYSMHRDCLSSVMYTIIVPLINPFIYSLRNKDVKIALIKIGHQKC
ncbi:olfactory receptor 9G4-like [Pelodytes ibericus]